MAEFLTEGYKTLRCRCGHLCTAPLKSTITKCPNCENHIMVTYFGTIAGHFY